MPKQTQHPLRGLTPAVLTPLDSAGELALATVEKQAALLIGDGISAVFVCGTTGEFSALTIPERISLVQRWCDVARGSALRVVVHVGSNSLAEARELARSAATSGAAAVATVAPSYVKPKTVADLVAWCAELAAAAPQVPFYFYDIPAMTGVALPMPEFMESAAARIPNLAGLKFTNPDLMTLQRLIHARGGAFDVVWGHDEYLLAALVLGAEGAVGSTYNFAAPLYHRLIAAFARSDIALARAAQFHSVELITLLYRYGFLAGCKEVMRVRGVDCGPVRMPNSNIPPERVATFRQELAAIGFERMLGG